MQRVFGRGKNLVLKSTRIAARRQILAVLLGIVDETSTTYCMRPIGEPTKSEIPGFHLKTLTPVVSQVILPSNAGG